MRNATLGLALVLTATGALQANAETFVELCEAQGETNETCECADAALAGEIKGQEMQLYVEVSLLNQMNLDDGIPAQTAWTNAAVEVAAGTGIGVGDVYESANRVEAAHRSAVAACLN